MTSQSLPFLSLWKELGCLLFEIFMTAERYCGEANVMHFLNNYRTRITKETQYELTIVRKFVKVVAKKCSQILLLWK